MDLPMKNFPGPGLAGTENSLKPGVFSVVFAALPEKQAKKLSA
jgi:hypothetical protein